MDALLELRIAILERLRETTALRQGERSDTLFEMLELVDERLEAAQSDIRVEREPAQPFLD